MFIPPKMALRDEIDEQTRCSCQLSSVRVFYDYSSNSPFQFLLAKKERKKNSSSIKKKKKDEKAVIVQIVV